MAKVHRSGQFLCMYIVSCMRNDRSKREQSHGYSESLGVTSRLSGPEHRCQSHSGDRRQDVLVFCSVNCVRRKTFVGLKSFQHFEKFKELKNDCDIIALGLVCEIFTNRKTQTETVWKVLNMDHLLSPVNIRVLWLIWILMIIPLWRPWALWFSLV